MEADMGTGTQSGTQTCGGGHHATHRQLPVEPAETRVSFTQPHLLHYIHGLMYYRRLLEQPQNPAHSTRAASQERA
jgi:hypothetical protein